MSTARRLIDRVVEEQEQATVRIELSGSPQAIQRGLKYLARQKGGLKKAVGAGATGATVKVAEPKMKPADKGGKDAKDGKFGKRPGSRI